MQGMNQMMLLQMMRNGGNPQKLAMSLLNNQAANNPMLSNLLALAKENKTQEVEKIARNLLQERGLDYDKEFNNFKQQLKF